MVRARDEDDDEGANGSVFFLEPFWR